MKVLVDSHTHTIASGHYTHDTIRELALSAKNKGLAFLGITDHSKAVISGAKDSYFKSLKMLSPKSIYGVKMLYGAEVNVIDLDGNVDLPNDIMNYLDYTVCSLHEEVIKPSSESANTKALLKAMDNKFINIIGHPENSAYPVNFSLLCEHAKQTNTIIELNAASIKKDGYRGDQRLLATALMRECKRFNCYVSLGSDSHGKDLIGDFNDCIALLKEVGIQEQYVVNCNIDTFYEVINKKRNS